MTLVRMMVWLPLACSALVAGGTAAGDAPPAATSRTRVVVLGSGHPSPNPVRSGPAIVVMVDDTPYLFDAGDGVVRQWEAAKQRMNLADPSQGLQRLFVTHLHSDHTLGLADLVLTQWTVNTHAPALDIHGPRGISAMAERILAAYAEDIAVRTGEGGEKYGESRPVVRTHEVEPGVVYRDGRVEVRAFAVTHGTWPQAFGYRIETPDKVIVLSGDATPSTAVAEQCNGCDLLLHEGGFVTDADSGPYFRAFHTTAEELAVVAGKAAPKLLVLYHQRAAGASTDRGYRTLRARYAGPFVVARDLDVYY